MLKHDVEKTRPQVRANTLVLRGSDDKVCPRSWVDRIVAAIPHSRLVEIPGSGHEVMMTHGAPVASLIVRHTEGRL
jgi:pimeloyl-ACP methyl ester carboxylesterase